MVDVLDYNPDVTQEKVTVYDGRKSAIRPGTINWAIEEDLVDYPVVSSGNAATLRWKVTVPHLAELHLWSEQVSIKSIPWVGNNAQI